MFAIFVGIILGIFICMFIPPKELAVKIITATMTLCDFLNKKGKEQLEKIEKEKADDSQRDTEED